jgi:hypothetical protein
MSSLYYFISKLSSFYIHEFKTSLKTTKIQDMFPEDNKHRTFWGFRMLHNAWALLYRCEIPCLGLYSMSKFSTGV